MNCICGCGTRLDRSQVGLNLLAGEVAIELVVWDKVRALGSPIGADEVAALLDAGAPHYQAVLAAIHADEGDGGEAAAREWIEESRAARQRLHGELPVPKKKIKLSDAEQARIDRRHPERSFSGGVVTSSEPPAPEREAADESPGVDPLLEALLVVALEDVRAGRPEEAKRALRRFLSDRS